jgi:ABC-2 type transport system permease protein
MTDLSLTHTRTLLPALSLCARELVRFVRQRNRIIGALATPLVFWLLIAEGLPGGDNYLRYFFPGSLLMILLFTAIFSTISIIEDRREGFLQGVLVAPVSRTAIVLGKLLGGTVLAFGQGLIFLLLAPTVGIRLSVGSVLLTAAVMLVVAFALTGLGFCIAWRMNSTQGFHAIMNLFLMPMWFLSGALFPVSGAVGGIGWLMRLNPLTYGLAALRRALYVADAAAPTAGLPGWGVSLGVTAAFAAGMLVLAGVVAGRRGAHDLQ